MVRHRWRLGALLLLCLALLAGASAAVAATNAIQTVAGTGTAGFAGDGGPATAARLNVPVQVLATADGGYYVADQINHRVRRVTAGGVISTVAGDGTAGFAGDGGAATAARLDAPSGLALAADGALLIADANNNRIRRVGTDGVISTVAGGGASLGDGGPATSAQLRFPYDIAVAADGSYLIADTDAGRIRKVATNGTISTVAGGGASTAEGVAATSASLNDPASVVLTGGGAFAIADTQNNKVRVVDGGGVIRTVAGDGVAGFSGDGGPGTAARLDRPARITLAPDGALLVADRTNNRIRRLAGGTISTIVGTGTAGSAGDGGAATAAQLNQAVGIDITADNDLLVADTFGARIRRVDLGDPPTTPLPPLDPPATPPARPVSPPPPPGPVTRNDTPPTVSSAFVTRTDPNYLCDAGRWSNVRSDFSYRWYRLGGSGFALRPVRVADSVTYRVPKTALGGRFYCEVTVTTTTGSRLTVGSAVTTLTGQPEIDRRAVRQSYGNVQVRGIDVFQTSQPSASSQTHQWSLNTYKGLCGSGVSTSYFPNSTACATPGLTGGDAQRADYQGVEVDADSDATAIVYVGSTDGAVSDPNAELVLRVRALVDGKAQRLVMTRRINGLRQRAERWVTDAERADGRAGFRIPLPATWLDAASRTTTKTLTLEASVSFPEGARLEECSSFAAILKRPGCSADNTFTLERVAVTDSLASLIIRTLPLVGSTTALNPPTDVLKAVTETSPGGNRMVIQPYGPSLDISAAEALTLKSDECSTSTSLRSCRMAAVGREVTAWLAASVENRNGYDVLLNVHRYATGEGGTEPGWKPNNGSLDSTTAVPRMFINDGSAQRPFTAAAHEFGHVLGHPHADRASSDPVSGSACGGNSGGQVGELWRPDNTGRLQGYAYGRYTALPNTIRGTDVDGDDPAAVSTNGALWDYMSYCGPENRAWLSPRNWQRQIFALRTYRRRAPARARQAGQAGSVAGRAFAVGVFGPKGASIARVVPAARENEVRGSVPGSPYQVVALAADGRTLGSAGADLSGDTDSPEPSGTFTAPLPSGAVAVEVRSGGRTVDRIQRTAPPKVRVTAPGRRTAVGPRGRLRVRWTTTDADSPRRSVTVLYAADGRDFRPVFQGPDRGRATIAGRVLPAGRRARVRVVVNDGFSTAGATSRRFRASGRGPVAQITAPSRGARVAGGRVLLRGAATDDRQQSLGDRALTWFDGRRRLGRGRSISAQISPGRRTVRLVARDRLGRSSSATVRVRVPFPPIEVTRLQVPTRVSPGARRARLRIATTVAGRLRIGGRSLRVGPRARTITLRLPRRPATGPLDLRYTVRSRGSRASGVARVLRF